MREVLVVDQDRLWVDLIREALAEQGVEVRVCADGAEALQLVRTASPDALVLSVDLKGVSGYSICNRLKKDPALARVPLLLTSAEASEETFLQHSRLKTRAEGYLRKPFDKDALWQAVAALWAPAASPTAASPAAELPVSWAPPDADAGPPAAGRAPAGDLAPGGAQPEPRAVELLDVEATKVAEPDLPAGPDLSLGALRPRPEPTADPGHPAAAGPQPEITVVRPADPRDLAASLPGPGGGAAAPAAGPPSAADPGAAPGEADDDAPVAPEPAAWRARLEAEQALERAGWRSRLEAAQAELAAARDALAALQARDALAARSLEEALRLLSGPQA